MSERPFDAELLARHTGWIRRLALELVRDPNVAEDLVQDTLLVALERPPREGAALARWLPRVLVTVERERRRREAQRRSREARAESARRHDAAESALELDVSAEIVDAVRELDEPYRSTVVLRWFDGLPPRRIARRHGVPVKTVDTRLARAHARLRERLDRRHGERRTWVLAVAPLLVDRAGRDVALSPSRRVAIVGTAALLAVVGVSLASLDDGRAVEVALARPTDAVAGAPETLRTPREAEPARALPRSAPAAEAPAAEPSAPPAPFLRGRVVDPSGAPIASATVTLHLTRDTKADESSFFDGPHAVRAEPDAVATLRTASDGSFELPEAPGAGAGTALPRNGFVLRAASEVHAPLVNGFVRTGTADDEHVLVVARRVAVAGRVVTPDGEPLPDAQVALRIPETVFSNLPARVSGASAPEVSAMTDVRGEFALAGLPAHPGTELVVRHDGYRGEVLDVPLEDALGLELVLAPLEGPTVDGRVLDGTGAPVPGASVTLGTTVVRTDARGEFRLPVDRSVSAHVLKAAARGLLPGAHVAPEPAPGEATRWPDDVVVFLEGRPASIEGRLVDERGAPVRGKVWLADATPFASDVADRGVLGRLDAERSTALHPPVFVEALLQERGSTWAVDTASDASGRFVLGGLLPREYRLGAMDLDTLARGEAVVGAAVRAVEGSGAEVTIVCDRSATEEVRGRVVARDGTPLEGVQVTPNVESVYADGPKDRYFSAAYLAPACTTDANGEFAFAALATDGLRLSVIGEDVLGGLIALRPGGDQGKIEIRVSRRAYLQLENAPPGVDGFSLLDEAGHPVRMQRLRGGTLVDFLWAPLLDGRSEVVTVAEGVRWLVLKQGEDEVARRPLTVPPGETVVVSL